MIDLAIIVPVLRRPQNVAPLLISILATTPGAHVVFVADPDDEPEIAAIKDVQDRYGALKRDLTISLLTCAGSYAKKINLGVETTDEGLIFTGADDLDFHPGWFETAHALMSDEIGVVGTQDLCNARTSTGEHSTHSLVTRWYALLGLIDGTPRLLCEEYEHEFVDDEMVATAKSRGTYAHSHDAVVEHLHPQVGKAPMDDLYAGQRVRMRQGRRVFQARQHLWT